MRTAVILAGGKGTRLRPYTVALPKPLVPIGDTPIAEILVTQLKRCGFDDLVLAVNHQADILRAFFQDGSRWGVNIRYSLETEPLGTMGPLRLIRDLPDDFLVVNGDVLTDLRFDTFLDDHAARSSAFTISAFRRSQPVDFGVLKTDGDFLSGFEEKPALEFEVSMGVYAVSSAILASIPQNKSFGFDDLMLRLLRDGQKVSVARHDGYWLDIGRPDDYETAVNDWPTLRKRLLQEPRS